jgi:serine protease Do
MKPARLLLAAIAAAIFAAAAHAEPDRLGLSLKPVTLEEDPVAGGTGAMIVEDASGPAALAGIQPGDLVIAVDGIPMEGAQTLRPFEKVTGTVALLIRRADETFYVPVALDDLPLVPSAK